MTVVLKVGGASIGRIDVGEEPTVVVHGAGPQISQEMERRGLEVRFVEGRRVTTLEALEVVRESFAEINAAVCATIGPDALPLGGAAPVGGCGDRAAVGRAADEQRVRAVALPRELADVELALLAHARRAGVPDVGVVRPHDQPGRVVPIGQVTPQRVRNAIRIGGTGQGRMPQNLLQGKNAQDVANFVASVAGR